uniref:Uncharacterized protein n=1 Tax=Cacopsylla melanoneura TaxID=428564 RepID=A0A8D8X8W2_9HEMI
MACNKWAAFKLTELIMCLLCLIYKWITDEEASRLFYLLEKISREWPLQKNITWNQAGDMFADVTFGSYAIICLGLLISSCSGELGYMRKTETVLLGIGVLMFFGVGCMVLASIDSIPHNLVDNAVILGTLTLLTGLLFLLDMGVTGNRHKSRKGQDSEFRLKRNIQLPLVPSLSDSGIKKPDIPSDVAKPEPSYQNGGYTTTAPPVSGYSVHQNGYQNAVNQTVEDPTGYVRNGIVEPPTHGMYTRNGNLPGETSLPHGGGYTRNGIVTNETSLPSGGLRNGVSGVSYTNGIKPMGELRSSMKKREMAQKEKERLAAEGRNTPDGYRMKDDSVSKAEYLQMGKQYTSQEIDLNRELIRKEREKENLELQNKYYDGGEYPSDKTYTKRNSLGRDLDHEPPRSRDYDPGYRRDKVKKTSAAAKKMDSSDEESDLNDRELARLSRRYRHYDESSEEYDDETLNQAARKLAQENMQRAAAKENKRNYYKQKSADELLLYGTEKYVDPYHEKVKRSKTPDYEHPKWRRDNQYDSKYYHSENEKDDHQMYLNKEKKSLQQWRFSQDLYKDNWRQQVQDEEKALNFPKHWKPSEVNKYRAGGDVPPHRAGDVQSHRAGGDIQPHRGGDIPPPSKFSDRGGAKYKSDSDDDSLANVQIPSVSFLMSERGKKIKPTITPSPIKTLSKESPPTTKDYIRDSKDYIRDPKDYIRDSREHHRESKDYTRDRDVLEDRITPQSVPPKQKFYFNSIRSHEGVQGGAQAGSGEGKSSTPAAPGDPGFVKHLASNWPHK